MEVHGLGIPDFRDRRSSLRAAPTAASSGGRKAAKRTPRGVRFSAGTAEIGHASRRGQGKIKSPFRSGRGFWKKVEARAGIEPAIEDLQSSALPLGDRAFMQCWIESRWICGRNSSEIALSRTRRAALCGVGRAAIQRRPPTLRELATRSQRGAWVGFAEFWFVNGCGPT